MLNVWVVDDDASIRWVLERALKQGGMSTTLFEESEAVLSALRRDEPDVLVTDIRMPGRSGLQLLEEIRAKRPRLPVIVMTAHSDLDSAVEDLCAAILAAPADAVRETKALLRAASSRGYDEQRAAERAAQGRRLRALVGQR